MNLAILSYSSAESGRPSDLRTSRSWMVWRSSSPICSSRAESERTSCRVSLPASETLLMSIRQPVSLAARRAFCPSRPIARLNWSSGTITVAVLPPGARSFRYTPVTRAGLMALAMKMAGSAFHSITSIFSLLSSLTIAWMRTPLMPTQAPTGSIPGWVAETATLARSPGSRAMERISTTPW